MRSAAGSANCVCCYGDARPSARAGCPRKAEDIDDSKDDGDRRHQHRRWKLRTQRASVMTRTNTNVYLVEDDEAVRDSLVAFLGAHGLRAQGYSSAEDYLAARESASDGCLVLDLNLPGMSGLDLLERLRASGVAVPSVLVTARRDARLDARADEAGVEAVFDKPVDLRALLATIRTALGETTATA